MRSALTIILTLFLFLSCTKDEYKTNIPDSYVSFEINLQQYPDFSNGIGTALICPDQLYSKNGGFGYAGGILLCHNLVDDFMAFDMCCTNPDCVIKKNKVIVNLSDANAYCPVCGSRFNIIIGYGDVMEGPAKYPLRTYKTSVSGDYLRVRRID